ncbi:class I adenylate-forming enzyme family protein [Nocardia aurantia]|uniref:Bile acid-coenzyme A ligase n=1 Tax=Nocardia aurantia TaxID=2585199 RepID=A0A7K0DWL2_9NOCA|nr:AMP-binding protein [Nocardia aurantia]MQY29224.1 Bile acid-coenzyme A ligase [Nocardia aurantia]
MTEPVSHARRIRERAAAHPGQPVYRHIAADGAEPVFDWRWLDRRSDQVAGALAERGLGHGDRLGLALRNSPQFVLSVFAAWKLGAVPVPMRWDLPDWELDRVREVVRPAVHLDRGELPWLDGTAGREPVALPDIVSPHTHGICSSGATGTPKVIMGTSPSVCGPHYNRPLADVWQRVPPIPSPQTILVLAPMYHINAFSTLNNLLGGDRLVVLERFDAARVVDVIERYRVSTFTATPIMLQRIADVPGIERRDLSSIEWIMQGAAPMPASLTRRWCELVGPEKIIMAYGSSEGVGITAIRGDEWLTHPGSVGRGIWGTEVRVLDDAGASVPDGQLGEIFLRMPGSDRARYLGATPQLTPTPDGFRSIGDLGHLDADGFLYLADRRADLIVSGGANIFPAEVETALIDHPKVADVVVIGLRDEQWGRRVHALIQPADAADPPGLAEIRAFAKSRLAAYKVPKSIEIVETIPRSEATKVNRGRLLAARGG